MGFGFGWTGCHLQQPFAYFLALLNIPTGHEARNKRLVYNDLFPLDLRDGLNSHVVGRGT